MSSQTAFLYLHGFASGPGSKKAQFFRSRFEQHGIGMEVPDLAAGHFEKLTISRQLEVVDAAAAGRPTVLLGSSMGGYLAALYAARHPEVEKLVLMAPAFRFARRWAETLGRDQMEQWKRSGILPVYHYGEGRECGVGYELFDDGSKYEEFPDISQPALLLHGTRDDVVPAEYSVRFAAAHPTATLQLFHSGHELTDVTEQLWHATAKFLSI